jgi:hypothetical protein
VVQNLGQGMRGIPTDIVFLDLNVVSLGILDRCRFGIGADLNRIIERMLLFFTSEYEIVSTNDSTEKKKVSKHFSFLLDSMDM